jgi:dipeptidyl-peptidase-3
LSHCRCRYGADRGVGCRARYGITAWLIENGIVKIEEVRSSSGELTDAYVRVDRKAALEDAKAIMGKLLVEIQTYKSTGDAKGATSSFSLVLSSV